MKLDLFSLSFVGWFMPWHIGWSCSLLNFAAWVSSISQGLDSCCSLHSRDGCSAHGSRHHPHRLVLHSLSTLDLAAVELEAMPYSRTASSALSGHPVCSTASSSG
ncbi:hypothetical protein BaRGS_00032131 [Batillaria attramentaria]|uniref:Secreted protein n=1 Tax=Batillaria attramentaria TaxID=370345 RepID=A0ABD0JPL1_9CAEN